jgi:CheY-like chemotaxis protein
LYLGTEQIDSQGLALEPGQYVKISIQDRGVGIPKEHLSKIFDPYFTTKDTGSGLGLTSVYSIVKNHNGQITVESEVGVGSTFCVILPVSGGDITTNSSANDRASTEVLKVLIMDDEEAVREIAGTILSELEGHEIAYAEHGDEAIELYCEAIEQGKPFDVVIMDLTIAGGTGGREAITQLLSIDPQAKVIVCSGYSIDPIMANYKDFGFSGVLRKPFSVDELLEEVRRVSGV